MGSLSSISFLLGSLPFPSAFSHAKNKKNNCHQKHLSVVGKFHKYCEAEDAPLWGQTTNRPFKSWIFFVRWNPNLQPGLVVHGETYGCMLCPVLLQLIPKDMELTRLQWWVESRPAHPVSGKRCWEQREHCSGANQVTNKETFHQIINSRQHFTRSEHDRLIILRNHLALWVSITWNCEVAGFDTGCHEANDN